MEESQIKPYWPVRHHSPPKENERQLDRSANERNNGSPNRSGNIDYPYRAPRWTESGYDSRIYKNLFQPRDQRPANTLNYSYIPHHAYPDYIDVSPPRNLQQDQSVKYYPLRRNSRDFIPPKALRTEILNEVPYNIPREIYPIVKARDDFDTKPANLLSERPKLIEHDPLFGPLIPEAELEHMQKLNRSKSRKGSKRSRGNISLFQRFYSTYHLIKQTFTNMIISIAFI